MAMAVACTHTKMSSVPPSPGWQSGEKFKSPMWRKVQKQCVVPLARRRERRREANAQPRRGRWSTSTGLRRRATRTEITETVAQKHTPTLPQYVSAPASDPSPGVAIMSDKLECPFEDV